MDKNEFIYIKVYIIVILRQEARMLVFININRVFFETDSINKLQYLDYFYVVCMTKTLMPESDLGVLALEIS